ncbi:GntR family transcriptional regulator [Streptomyces sp. bgisy060]|uniref:GntR family transcriptional regulator n=1 Tax=Streptomyces sp. bgisy060 TaxID=3413775 RepID=UPI003EBF0401
MISFRLDRGSALAPYAQLVQQVQEALRMGWIAPGDRLPPLREVVAECVVNANTVLRAYRELEMSGLVETRQGLGTFIREDVVTVEPKVMARLQVSLARWVRTATDAGLAEEDIRALLNNALTDRSGGDAAQRTDRAV